MTENEITTTLRIPEDLHARIREMADADDRSMNYWILRACEQRIDLLANIGEISEEVS